MGPIRRFFRLPKAKKRLIIEATGLILFTRFGLYLTSIEKLQSFYQRFSKGNNYVNHIYRPDKSDIVWAIDTIGQKLFKDDTCLVIAIAGQAQLIHYGIPSKLQLGCLKGEDMSIFAHAWVESDGDVIIGGTESEISKYTPLTDIRKVRI